MTLPPVGGRSLNEPNRSAATKPGKRLDCIEVALRLPEPAESPSAAPSWIGIADGAPYFVDGAGAAWTPVGQNDALTCPSSKA